VLVVRVVGDQFRESVSVRAGRCDSLEDDADPAFPEVESSLVIVVRIVGDVHPVEIRRIVAFELDEPATPQLVEGLDHARAAEVERAEVPRLGLVPRVRRPAVVERGLRLCDDLADGRLDRRSVPRRIAEGLVALGVEERQR
jgi:hypothetical protein